ncbi:hypothetical protein ACFV1N_40580 [Streptosporangium canum]|uniref:hypothetical protein n=1 Tax=Streptosporangium canum TaxID=324952 RepID=UPI0036B1C5FA
MFAPSAAGVTHPLDALAEQLERHYDSAYTLIAYLKGTGGKLIRRLAAGEVACTHEGLDELPQTGAVDHLRMLLVVSGLLEDRNEEQARADRRLRQLLTQVQHDDDRRVLGQFMRWYLLPFLHQRGHQDGSHHASVRYVIRQFTGAHMFLDHLRAHDVTLADCPQPLVDLWTGRHGWRRGDLKRFLIWAASRGLAPDNVAIAAMTTYDDRSIMTDSDRVLLALKLEDDETIALHDRITGCLVLQYGQHVTRIAKITLDQVLDHPQDSGALGLQLGADPLWLRPRLSQLLARLLDERRAADPGPKASYLFPGRRSGRPIAADTLTSRLRDIGIPSARLARNGALLSMVDQVHWKLLADLLGISDNTAYRWHTAGGGDRASYVASRLERATVSDPE